MFFFERNILKKSLSAVSEARALMSKPERSSLCVIDYDDLELPNTADKLEIFNSYFQNAFVYKGEAKQTNNRDIIDYNTELLYTYLRLSLKLAITPKADTEQVDFEKEFETLLKDCRKNKTTQSLLYLCKAFYLIQSDPDNKSSDRVRQSIKIALDRVLEAQADDKLMNEKHVKMDIESVVKGKIPPAPIVLMKSGTSVTLCPRKFETTSGVKPSWYRVFVSQKTNINSRSRVTDYSYPGSGEQVPADGLACVRVEGLRPDERYVFALGAYDEGGELVSDSIGESTDPVLASEAYSILYCWTLICQFCFQISENQLALTVFEQLRKHFIIEVTDAEVERAVLRNEPDFRVQCHQ